MYDYRGRMKIQEEIYEYFFKKFRISKFTNFPSHQLPGKGGEGVEGTPPLLNLKVVPK